MVIDLFGYIGEAYAGEGEEKGIISAQRVIDALGKANGQGVTLRVFSKGGDFFEASAIHAAISMYDGDVRCKVLGLAASAASFFIMACDEIIMESTAQLMIHNARSAVWGDKNMMRKKADQLETIQEGMVMAFVEKTEMNRDQIEQMLDDETWMGAERAETLGFIDKTFKATGDENRVAASITKQEAEALHYESVPDSLLSTKAQAGQSTQKRTNNNQTDSTMNEQEIIAALGMSANGDIKTSAVVAKIQDLATKAQELDTVKAELETAQSRVGELEDVEAKYQSAQAELEKSKAKEIVANVLEETNVEMSDDHEAEVLARAQEYMSADESKKDRIMADMKNYASVNGVTAGSNGMSDTKSRKDVIGAEDETYEAKLDSIATAMMEKDSNLSYIDAIAKAEEQLAEDETATEMVIH